MWYCLVLNHFPLHSTPCTPCSHLARLPVEQLRSYWLLLHALDLNVSSLSSGLLQMARHMDYCCWQLHPQSTATYLPPEIPHMSAPHLVQPEVGTDWLPVTPLRCSCFGWECHTSHLTPLTPSSESLNPSMRHCLYHLPLCSTLRM